MKLSEHLCPDAILVHYPQRDKNQAIEDLVDLACCSSQIEDRQRVMDAVFEREKQISTGVGCGLGVPHAKIPGISQLRIAALACPQGLDFESLDSEPAHLVFLLLSPEQTVGPHIRALSCISRLMADAGVRKQLTYAETGNDFIMALREAEEKYA